MKWINRLYYAIQRRKFGINYGCGRCHHGHIFHDGGNCSVKGCPCKSYSIERTTCDCSTPSGGSEHAG